MTSCERNKPNQPRVKALKYMYFVLYVYYYYLHFAVCWRSVGHSVVRGSACAFDKLPRAIIPAFIDDMKFDAFRYQCNIEYNDIYCICNSFNYYYHIKFNIIALYLRFIFFLFILWVTTPRKRTWLLLLLQCPSLLSYLSYFL